MNIKIIITTLCTLSLFFGSFAFSKQIRQNENNSPYMIASFPKQGIYYYYYKNFKPENFSKPKEVVPVLNDSYTIFVYDKNLPADNFKKYEGNGHFAELEDDPGDMFQMQINGIKYRPKYYIYRHTGCTNSYEGKCIDICKLNFETNDQIKYTAHPWTGEIVKQMRFNNGSIGFPNVCNPDWIPKTDI